MGSGRIQEEGWDLEGNWGLGSKSGLGVYEGVRDLRRGLGVSEGGCESWRVSVCWQNLVTLLW